MVKREQMRRTLPALVVMLGLLALSAFAMADYTGDDFLGMLPGYGDIDMDGIEEYDGAGNITEWDGLLSSGSESAWWPYGGFSVLFTGTVKDEIGSLCGSCDTLVYTSPPDLVLVIHWNETSGDPVSVLALEAEIGTEQVNLTALDNIPEEAGDEAISGLETTAADDMMDKYVIIFVIGVLILIVVAYIWIRHNR